jgi:hypothetical protein
MKSFILLAMETIIAQTETPLHRMVLGGFCKPPGTLPENIQVGDLNPDPMDREDLWSP